MNAPVLVLGGTGGTGSHIVRLLCTRGIRVRMLVRKVARARDRFPVAEVVAGDLTRPDTLPPAVAGAAHIIMTAGVTSGRPATESKIKATEYDGVLHLIEAARRAGFAGRFLYMTACGVTIPSFWTWALNVYKGNTLRWRLRAEEAIRASGFDYSVIRAGFLVNAPPGQHEIVVTQKALPLSFIRRIARGDVAAIFVAALEHPRASRATFDVVWGTRRANETGPALLDHLRADSAG